MVHTLEGSLHRREQSCEEGKLTLLQRGAQQGEWVADRGEAGAEVVAARGTLAATCGLYRWGPHIKLPGSTRGAS